MVWLAGQIATVDDAGKSLASDFDGQVRQIFKNLDRTLQKTGGKLGDMVQMTVFITDVRYGDRLTQIRREVFGDNFPGSASSPSASLSCFPPRLAMRGCWTPPDNSPHGWPAMGTPNHSTSKKTRPPSRLTGRGATTSREPHSFTWIEKPAGSPPSTDIRRTN